MIKKLIILALVLLGSLVFALPPQSLQAQTLFPSCDGDAANSAVCQGKDKPEKPECNSFYGKCGVLTKAVSLVAIVTGVVAVVMIIIGGFKFVTASGDPANVKSAKNTILFAIVGLVVAAIGGAIIRFVIGRL